MNAIGNVFHHGLKGSNNIATKADGMDKVAKITYRWIDLIELLTHSVSKPLKLLSSRMKVLSDMFETTRFFGIAGVLTSQNSEGVYFLQNKRNTWQKKLDRICLFYHTGLKMINGGYKYGLLNLGPIIPSYRIFGGLTAFKFVTDGFVVLSSIFGAWDSSLTLTKEKKYLHDTVKLKIKKWEYRPVQAALVETGNQVEINELKAKYKYAKKIKEDELKELKKQYEGTKFNLSAEGLSKLSFEKQQRTLKEGPGELRKLSEEIAHFELVKAKFERRLQWLNSGDYRSVANELRRNNREFKLRKWDLRECNSEIKISACWLKIAAAVAKIAIVSLAITVTALSLGTTAWLASLLAVGLISDSIGLTKIFYESFNVVDSEEEVKHLKKEEQRRKLGELSAMTASKAASTEADRSVDMTLSDTNPAATAAA